MKFILMFVMLSFVSCTTYSIGKFDSIKMQKKGLELSSVTSEQKRDNSLRTVKDCSLQFFTFPLVTHDLKRTLGKLCPKSHVVRDVEIHEEFWSTLAFGQVCTVVTGRCSYEKK